MDTGMKPVLQVDKSHELEIRKKRLHDQCREFESVMVSYLMKTMRDGVIRADEPDNAQAMYEDMLDGQVSKTLSKTSALGIGDMLYAKLEPLVKAQTSEGTVNGEPASTITVRPAQPDTTGPNAASKKATGTKELF